MACRSVRAWSSVASGVLGGVIQRQRPDREQRQRLIDLVRIVCVGGAGGGGCESHAVVPGRARKLARDGGNGGKGGDVIIVAGGSGGDGGKGTNASGARTFQDLTNVTRMQRGGRGGAFPSQCSPILDDSRIERCNGESSSHVRSREVQLPPNTRSIHVHAPPCVSRLLIDEIYAAG